MNRKILHKTNDERNSNHRQTPPRLRGETDARLREIAFVLKMTERIRDEIEADQEAEESVPLAV